MLNVEPNIESILQVAIAHHQAGRLQQAESQYRQILILNPNHAVALNLLGTLASQHRRFELAVELIQKAIALSPDYADAHGNLGAILRNAGRPEEAIAACQKCVALNPGGAEGFLNLGHALADANRFTEAITAFQRAGVLQPHAKTYISLGNCWADQGYLDEAIAAYRQAQVLDPSDPEASNNLGNALKDRGELDAAIAAYRHAMELRPRLALPHSNLVYTLHFHPAYDTRRICEELEAWNRRHADPMAPFIQPHANNRDPARRLRVGYVSPDFRSHPVGRFIQPLLSSHNREDVEIFAYAHVSRPDTMTQRIHASVDTWRDIRMLSDNDAADLIRGDGIDILVDLAMHMGGNRLTLFARKPAPVQVTYLAYCSSTGMRTMDYRLSDPYLEQAGSDEPMLFRERSVRLPQTYWCYQPSDDTPDPNAVPALTGGPFTFGCLNNFCKMSERALAVWADILRKVPRSNLLLHAHEGSHRQRIQDVFASRGVESGRIQFASLTPLADYYRLYHKIDVALDTFPYAGGTTTCDALWMGVPVVTLAGGRAVGRSGVSILSNMGLTDWIASTEEGYCDIAVKMAGDLNRLRSLRGTLRDRMKGSPLMDGPAFARGVEAAYRDMWRRWCTSG